MQPFLRFTLSLFFISFVLTGVIATASAEPALTEREAAMQAEIEQLKAQLQGAQQTISGLESRLDTPATAPVAVTAPTGTQQMPATTTVGSAAKTSIALTTSPADRSETDLTAMHERNWVPASITSLNAERLSLGGVEDISRLEFLTPGLRYGQTGHDARVSMRGARTNSIGPEAASIVGVYEDGIYIPTSTTRLDSFLDMQRVDVLRGPQLTTFGQQAYAGAISLVTNKPNFDGFHGSAEAENGIPDRTRWTMVLNVPVSKTLALRVAGLSESRSGLINNHVIEPDSDDLSDRKEQTLRTSLLWQPSENFSILLRRKFQDENGTGTAPWGYQQIGAYINGELQPGHQFAPEGFVPDTGPWDVYRNFISAAQSEHELNTLDLNWNMGFASLQWLSNWTKYEGSQIYDSDFSSAGDFTSSAFAGWNSVEESFSSELRLASNGDGALNWLLGLYWSDRDSEWGWLEANNGIFFQPDWDVKGDFSTDTQAVFGQVSYAFSDRLTLTGGLRWNDESKTLRTGEHGSWDDVVWKAALQYEINTQLMTYFSASTGYLPGGNNSAPGVNPTWEPENLTAYELGLKGTLADGTVHLSMSAWYNDFKDVQSQSFLVLPFPGSPEATEYTGNGGALDAMGADAEIQWSPLPQWQIATNIAYTDAEFDNYSAANLAGLGDIPGHTEGDTLAFDGWSPALTPKWVFGLQTSYTFNFKKWGSLTPYFQTTYASSYYASDINLAGTRQGSHNKTDFRLIWQANTNFQIQLYYYNLEDEAALNWVRVYNPAARPDITTLQANWTTSPTNGIIFNYTF